MIINLTDIERAKVLLYAQGCAYKSIVRGDQRVIIVLTTSDPDNLSEVVAKLASQARMD